MNENELVLFNRNFEVAVISSIIFENETFNEISEILDPDDFYLPNCKEIFRIMGELNEAQRPMDESFIVPELLKVNKNAEFDVLDILAANPITNYMPYVEEIRNFSQRRKLNHLALEIRKTLSEDEDADVSMAKISDKLDTIQLSEKTASSARDIREVTQEIRDDMEKARTGEVLPFFRTGYVNFDSYIGGFPEEGLTVVAARPSMGKSAFMSSPIVNTLEKGDASVLYSMEVVDKKALARLVSFRSQEPLSSMKMGTVGNLKAFNESMRFYEDAHDNFAIVDRSGMTRKDLEIDIIKRLKRNPNLKSIFVDHLLQMSLDPKKHAPTELGDITKMLKRISQNYKVTIILLSQLNRSVESRDNKRPMMSDLQGSGSIEQDADMIVFLYRPEYYREKEWDNEKDGQYVRPEVEQAEALVGKNRDGPTGSVELGFRAVTASFMNDHIPAEVVEYVDDAIDAEYSEEIHENVDSSALNKENDGTIYNENDSGNVQMPLI